jgi:hypothetical protein
MDDETETETEMTGESETVTFFQGIMWRDCRNIKQLDPIADAWPIFDWVAPHVDEP